MDNKIRFNKNKLILATIIILTTVMIFSLTTATATAAAQENFEVEIIENNAPVTEGENLEITAEIHNSGENDGSQNIELLNFDDNTVDNEIVQIDNGENENVTLTWEPEEGDADTDNITVQSENDNDSIEVTIENKPAFFEVEIINNNAPITEGENLEITAKIRNTGNKDNTQNIELLDFGGENVVDENSVILENGENKTVILTWEPEEGDADTDNITVQSENDNDSIEVSVDPLVFFRVVDIVPESGVVEGEKLKVTAFINNSGENEGTQNIELIDSNGNVLDTQNNLTIDSGSADSIKLTWNTDDGDAGTHNIKVRSDDDDYSKTVEILESDTFQVEIIDYDHEAVECEDLKVTAEIHNTGDVEGTQDIELLDFNGDTVDTYENLTLRAGELENVTLTWGTEEGDGGMGDITVASDDNEDAVNVTILHLKFFEVEIVEYDDEVIEGENLKVTAEIHNTGENEGTEDIELYDFNDNVVDTYGDLTLGSDDLENADLIWSTEEGDAGSGNITVASEDEEYTVNVSILKDVLFEVSNLTVSPKTVKSGEKVQVSADIKNVGELTGEREVEFLVGGERENSKTLELVAGESETVEFETYRGQEDNYEVMIDSQDDSKTGTFKVEKIIGHTLTISTTEGGTTDPEPNTYTFEENKEVTIEAKPYENYVFNEWTGDYPEGKSDNKTITIIMDENKELTTHFEEEIENEYTLTISVEKNDPPHIVKILVNDEEIKELPSGKIFPITKSFEQNEKVNVQLKSPRIRFDKWTGDYPLNQPKKKDIIITIDGNNHITAVFESLPPIPENMIMEEQSKNISKISPGIPEIVKITKTDVENVKVNVKENVEDANLTTKQLTDKLKGLPDPDPAGIMYSTFEFDGRDLPDAENYDGEITTKVPKSWIVTQSIDENKLTMKRYNEEMDEWENLPTEVIGENEKYLFIKADTEEFSLFSVTGKPKTSRMPWTMIATMIGMLILTIVPARYSERKVVTRRGLPKNRTIPKVPQKEKTPLAPKTRKKEGLPKRRRSLPEKEITSDIQEREKTVVPKKKARPLEKKREPPRMTVGQSSSTYRDVSKKPETEEEKEVEGTEEIREEYFDLIEEFLDYKKNTARVRTSQPIEEAFSVLNKAVKRVGLENEVKVLIKKGRIYLEKI